jgi:hypothetical protein
MIVLFCLFGTKNAALPLLFVAFRPEVRALVIVMLRAVATKSEAQSKCYDVAVRE